MVVVRGVHKILLEFFRNIFKLVIDLRFSGSELKSLVLISFGVLFVCWSLCDGRPRFASYFIRLY